MKQIVTIFRAEGRQALRVLELFRDTEESLLFALRDSLRTRARDTNQFTGYQEFLDPWSMGDSFDNAMGPDSTERKSGRGDVYCTVVTDEWIQTVKKQRKKSYQFAEDQRLHASIRDLVTTPFLTDAAITILLFREIVGGSVTDFEFIEGSEQTDAANRHPFGTSGMAPADPASRAGAMPEASGDS